MQVIDKDWQLVLRGKRESFQSANCLRGHTFEDEGDLDDEALLRLSCPFVSSGERCGASLEISYNSWRENIPLPTEVGGVQAGTIMEYQADVTALSACLRDLMKAYERLRSDCTPEQLKQRPWPVAEYLAAEEALKNATRSNYDMA